MSDKIREALEGMLAIHDEPSGFTGKYGRALDEAIEAQRVKIDQRIAAARAALAKVVPDEMDETHAGSSWESSYRHGWNACRAAMLDAAPAAPVAQEPVAYLTINERGQCQLTVGRISEDSRPLYTAPPAAEQPDTVPVPRELLEELADIADAMQCYDARDDAIALLGKEGEE